MCLPNVCVSKQTLLQGTSSIKQETQLVYYLVQIHFFQIIGSLLAVSVIDGKNAVKPLGMRFGFTKLEEKYFKLGKLRKKKTSISVFETVWNTKSH